jgi:hypothetical protein
MITITKLPLFFIGSKVVIVVTMNSDIAVYSPVGHYMR